MSNIKRRGFLQLLGVGAATSIVPVPLFASDDTSIWTPDHSLLEGHIVLTRPLDRREPGGFTRSGTPAVGGRLRWPKAKGEVYRVPGENEGSDIQNVSGVFVRRGATGGNDRWMDGRGEVDLPMVDSFGEESHIDVVHTAKTGSTLGYYKASMQLRDRFKEQSVTMLDQVPQIQRAGIKIITLVNTPIFVGPLDTALWRDYNKPGEDAPEGFRVSMDYVQYLVRGDVGYNGWSEYSTTGEFPIEQPSYIDWDHIYALDKKFIEGDLETRKLPKGISRLILP